jgi:hypothetical protein
MSRDKLIETLSLDLNEGELFWPADDCEEASCEIGDLIDRCAIEEPFEVARSVSLSNVWVVPYTTPEGDADYGLFRTKPEADIYFASLRIDEPG